MADKARQKTDKRLENMEKEMGRIYRSDPALKNIRKKYDEYMKSVKEKTKDIYDAYKNESDRKEKEQIRKEYEDAVLSLTIYSKKYKQIIDSFTSELARVNQEALDIINRNMVEVYVENYNEIAEECKSVGIKVDG